MNHRPQLGLKQRSIERRQREDAAPRLSAEISRLVGLRFEIQKGDSWYAWPIVIERAPALFQIACSESTCKDGGYDITMDVMSALRRSSARIEGNDVCRGQLGSGTCGRILRYVGVATYRT